MTKTNVATRDAQLPSTSDSAMLADYAGMGMEHVGAKDLTIPRFKILQDLSPEVNKRKDTYVEGAEPGMIYNTGLKTIHNEVVVVPCIYRRHHIEWLPNRGGFVADHGEDDSLLRQARPDEKRNMILPNGNLIVETATWYCIEPATGNQVVIPMSRTQLGPSRDWMTLATAEKLDRPDGAGRYTPPLFYRTYALSTVLRERGEDSWFVWRPRKSQTILEAAQVSGQNDLLQQAIKFAELVRAGEVKVGADTFEDDGARREQEDEDAPM